MNLFKFLGFSVLLFVLNGFALAESKEKIYAGLDAHYIKNSIGDEAGENARFKMITAGLRAGFYLVPQVGVEVYLAKGFGADTRLGIDVDTKSMAGVSGRFESPETEEGFKLYVLLGYGMTELEMKRSTSSLPDREIFHGLNYGLGGEVRIGESDSFINIQGLRYYDEDDFVIGGLSVGIRQNF